MMRQFRCAKCKKVLAYIDLKSGIIEIKCRRCKKVTQAEALNINQVIRLLTRKGGEKI